MHKLMHRLTTIFLSYEFISYLTYTLQLKTGYIEFAWLESFADAIPAVMLSPAVAMAAVFS